MDSADTHRAPRAVRPDRQQRADGDATRAEIIETAGQRFAERGYADTTAKSICVAAGVNMAAINYHFGGREGLYLAVLKEVHQRVLGLAFLRELNARPLPAPEKLRIFLHGLIARVLDGESWPIRVWAREVLSPSPLLDQTMREDLQPKFEVLAQIVSEIAGVSPDDPRTPERVLGVIAPCLVLLIADRRSATPIQGLYARTPEALADHFLRFAVAGLRG